MVFSLGRIVLSFVTVAFVLVSAAPLPNPQAEINHLPKDSVKVDSRHLPMKIAEALVKAEGRELLPSAHAENHATTMSFQ
ncbi:hypothetical protein FISHEDRAFT_73275 [Fistulina hepatica ATCC 64428]|uniref:Uncharacterized protein n=1 Tax=Fistulina hepatica ATCC 64428 TaxID=1128425 RepID=A0A0D7ACY0_9AGAR|nr:hypothetical protein FISHEDRAFT_73275 [Fistulina hepatica ATCC 64428]